MKASNARERGTVSGRWLAISCCALIAALGSPAPSSAQVKLTVQQPDGRTPRYVGYNFRGLAPRDVTWLEHSGVNGGRMWMDTDAQSEPNPAIVGSRQEFIFRRQDTRTEINDGALGNGYKADCSATLQPTTASNYINWAHYFEQWRSREYTMDQMVRLGIAPVIQNTIKQELNTGLGPSAPAYWLARWELWRHVFALAYHAASRRNLTTWEIYNEPNLFTSQEDYRERLHIAADAIQLAIKTVNKRRTRCGGPQLSAKILAPGPAGGPQIYAGANNVEAWADQPEAPYQSFAGFFCDPNINTPGPEGCWSRYILQRRTTNNFYTYSLSAADSFATLFQGFSFHWYTIKTWNSDLSVNDIRLKTGEKNLRDVWTYSRYFPIATPAMDLYITEQNMMSDGDWGSLTPDSPILVPRFAQTLMHDARANPSPDPWQAVDKNVYIFRLQQAGAKENGLHYVDTTTDLSSGATLMAEAARLFARGFKGARTRYPITSDNGAIDALGAFAANDGYEYHAMVVNRDATAQTVTLDMAPWSSIPASVDVRIESVTPEQRNSAVLQSVQNRVVTFTVPGYGVTLVTAPGDPTLFTNVYVGEDTTVKGGSNRSTNYGTSGSLYAAANATSSDARNATLLKFTLPTSVDKSKIKFVMLRVFGQARTTGGTVGTEAITHVYGLDNDSWSETTVTGATAPNLAFHDGPTTQVAHNFVTGIGETAHIVGHFTGRATAASLSIDVSDYVRKHPDRTLTFLVLREVRFDASSTTDADGDELTTQNRSLWMASREVSSASQWPRLEIISRTP
jgi:hypothetical protein